MSTPSSTYRLQIRSDFDLTAAAELCDYLVALGADAVYLSPLLAATSGSDHGYDVVDPGRWDEARGGEAGWDTLVAAAREAGLKVVVDIVPNHLGVSKPAENPAWWSVLAEGRESPWADFFDIDWARGPLTIPVLGDDAEQELAVRDGELRYHEHRFPLAAGSWEDGADVATVHGRQHYRLIHWSRADAELTYRRFFAVNELAGLRVELPEVFEADHRRILQAVEAGEIDGLRIDHPDGLVDPAGYFEQLRAAVGPDTWLVAEKILEPGEQLPDWPVAGTTGYDALREACGVFVDPSASAEFSRLYAERTGDHASMHETVLAGKRHVAEQLFATERTRIVRLLPPVAPQADLMAALAELAAQFAVYRSYLPEGSERFLAAADRARTASPDLVEAIDALTPLLLDPGQEAARRFQQLSGAVMAKGTEDTAYYRQARFIALNEVGGDPDSFGLELSDFHTAQQQRQRTAAHAMTTLSTHDTKRGEDIRARLAVLAEVPQLWLHFHEQLLSGSSIPAEGVDRARFAWFWAQTLAGFPPAATDAGERLEAYLTKAMREAATVTGWNSPDADYETAVASATRSVLTGDLRDAWDRLVTQLEQPGWSNALGQKLVQLTMPGIPDVYQGTELWEDSLVDPDNRRPVDFDRRRALLTDLAAGGVPEVDASGAAKLLVVSRALQLRREQPQRFVEYRPLLATGSAADHLIGFDRGGAITLATRLPHRLGAGDGWGATTVDLPAGVDVLTGQRIDGGPTPVAGIFAELPVALIATS